MRAAVSRLTGVLSALPKSNNAGSPPPPINRNHLPRSIEAKPSLIDEQLAVPQIEQVSCSKLRAEASKLRQYEISAALKDAKDQGCAPSMRIQNEVIFPFLLQRCNGNLASSSVTLCNMHDVELAERLFSHGCREIRLVEKSLQHARKAKAFAREKAKESQCSGVSALHGDFGCFFAQGKNRKASIYKKMLGRSAGPFQLNSHDSDRPAHPLLVFTFSLPSQHAEFMAFLRRGLMHTLASKFDKLCPFEFGAVELFTFLNPASHIQLMCGVDARLNFVKPHTKRLSDLMHKLFFIDPYFVNSPIMTTDFTPTLPLNAYFSHEKKLQAIGYDRERLSAVSIRPRDTIRIGGYVVGRDDAFPTADLLKFVNFVMLLAKPGTKTATNEIQRILTSDRAEALLKDAANARAATMSFELLESAFLEFRDEINPTAEWIRKEASLC